jgi:hypothetical protein
MLHPKTWVPKSRGKPQIHAASWPRTVTAKAPNQESQVCLAGKLILSHSIDGFPYTFILIIVSYLAKNKIHQPEKLPIYRGNREWNIVPRPAFFFGQIFPFGKYLVAKAPFRNGYMCATKNEEKKRWSQVNHVWHGSSNDFPDVFFNEIDIIRQGIYWGCPPGCGNLWFAQLNPRAMSLSKNSGKKK